MSCKSFLKLKGWTDIKALESIKNEGLHLCVSTLCREAAFFFPSSPAPFWHFGDALCAAVCEVGLELLSDFLHLSSITACILFLSGVNSHLREVVVLSSSSL